MEIVEFDSAHAEAFRTLNEAWIAKHFAIEAKDREVIDDPQGQIIAKGGRVFMAVADGAPVGCVTVAPVSVVLIELSFNPNDEPSSVRLVTVVVNGGDATVR